MALCATTALKNLLQWVILCYAVRVTGAPGDLELEVEFLTCLTGIKQTVNLRGLAVPEGIFLQYKIEWENLFGKENLGFLGKID